MFKHTLRVVKPFMITSRKGNIIKLPVGYKITGTSNSYTDEIKRIEKTNFICDEDDKLIEEKTEIRGLHWAFVQYQECYQEC